jgi:bacteriocin biosynthesis cyclodehydratase domain-containing protein
MPDRRPRLALPFTVLPAADAVRLVAGEDFRYTLAGPGLEQWLPDWLAGFDGRAPLAALVERLPESRRSAARELADRLFGERVLIDGTAADAHAPVRYRLAIEGSAAWAAGWSSPPGSERDLPVLCQDRLDYDEALRFNHRFRTAGTPWLWATTGPMSRAYVSPLFLPDAGPCLACLLNHFRRLSPAPDLYNALADHARAGGPVTAVPFPAPGVAVVQQLVRWKADLAAEPDASPALYRLHVLDAASLEVSSHRVFVDPECLECSRRS